MSPNTLLLAGLTGRGLLDKYGPNHAALPIITRLAKDENGADVIAAGKPVFEVLLELRGETTSLPEIKGIYDDPLPAEVYFILFTIDKLFDSYSNKSTFKYLTILTVYINHYPVRFDKF